MSNLFLWNFGILILNLFLWGVGILVIYLFWLVSFLVVSWRRKL